MSVQNGVIETTTGDLLRAALAPYDFSIDGAFDAATETVKTDVPRPAKVRYQQGETQMHRWSGSTWVLVTQPVIPATVETVTANVTLTDFHQSVLADTADGAFVITLPSSHANGKEFSIRNIGTNTLTINRNGKKINGATINLTLTPDDMITLTGDGTDWWGFAQGGGT